MKSPPIFSNQNLFSKIIQLEKKVKELEEKIEALEKKNENCSVSCSSFSSDKTLDEFGANVKRVISYDILN